MRRWYFNLINEQINKAPTHYFKREGDATNTLWLTDNNPLGLEVVGFNFKVPPSWFWVLIFSNHIDPDTNKFCNIGLWEMDAARIAAEKFYTLAKSAILRVKTQKARQMLFNKFGPDGWFKRGGILHAKFVDSDGKMHEVYLDNIRINFTKQHLLTRSIDLVRSDTEGWGTKIGKDIFMGIWNVLSWEISPWGPGLRAILSQDSEWVTDYEHFCRVQKEVTIPPTPSLAFPREIVFIKDEVELNKWMY